MIVNIDRRGRHRGCPAGGRRGYCHGHSAHAAHPSRHRTYRNVVFHVDDQFVARLHMQRWRLRSILGHKTKQPVAELIHPRMVGEAYLQHAVIAKEILRFNGGSSNAKPRAIGRLAESGERRCDEQDSDVR